ncbi:MAG: hypothetical protein ACXWYP_06080 [Pseudonocardia sp.]
MSAMRLVLVLFIPLFDRCWPGPVLATAGRRRVVAMLPGVGGWARFAPWAQRRRPSREIPGPGSRAR